MLTIGCEVVIATDGLQQSLLEQEFPQCRFVKLPGYQLHFGTNRWKTLSKIIGQVPKILRVIRQEHDWLKSFLLYHDVDFIISDNRYGFYSRKIPSVFITHQLTIKTPFGNSVENILRIINYYFIQKFTECWVPDFEGSTNMAGELSHPKKLPSLPVRFLGRLSRIEKKLPANKQVELLIILSGPEPQRSIFETMLLEQLGQYPGTAVLVRGLPGEKQSLASNSSNLTVFNHLGTEPLNQLMVETTYIISRSGYSSVMDLIGLHKKCIFVPTPGQSEQEYLARYLSSRGWCLSFPQDKFSMENAIKDAREKVLLPFELADGEQFKKVVGEFVEGVTGI